MYKFCLKTVIICVFFILTACETTQTNNSADYQQAKADFMAQNYTKAFQEVQGPARAGNADAQYALGYMYYYGKGTVENRGLALFWLGRASSQGQEDAKKALAMIQS